MLKTDQQELRSKETFDNMRLRAPNIKAEKIEQLVRLDQARSDRAES